MVFIPRKVLKGKHYAIYRGAKTPIKTKARLLKEALGKIAEEDEHVEWIDFIPAKFTLQLHGWFSSDSPVYKIKGNSNRIAQVQAVIKKALKAGKDPLKIIDKEEKAKSHYDLRIQKASAPSWFGLTPFRAPWTGTIENKVLGTVKGYASIFPGGKKLGKFLLEKAESVLAIQGIAERRDRVEWMKVKAQWFPKDSPGNPTKNLDAYMIAIEYYKPAVLHRRELDFFDITFFGEYLNGRYYNRLVEREIATDKLMEWQKKAISQGRTKKFYDLSFYFWKAKDQWGDKGTEYSMKDLLDCVLGKKTLERIKAPPKK